MVRKPNMGEYILNGGKVPHRKQRLKRGLNVSQNSFLKKTKGFNKNRFTDHDGDGVISGMDCYPFDKKRHDTWNPFSGNWKKDREIPDIMRDGLHESLDVTRAIGKYGDPTRGQKINPAPLVQAIQKRRILKQQMQRFPQNPDRLNPIPIDPDEDQGVELS